MFSLRPEKAGWGRVLCEMHCWMGAPAITRCEIPMSRFICADVYGVPKDPPSHQPPSRRSSSQLLVFTPCCRNHLWLRVSPLYFPTPHHRPSWPNGPTWALRNVPCTFHAGDRTVFRPGEGSRRNISITYGPVGSPGWSVEGRSKTFGLVNFKKM